MRLRQCLLNPVHSFFGIGYHKVMKLHLYVFKTRYFFLFNQRFQQIIFPALNIQFYQIHLFNVVLFQKFNNAL